jgi:hypothetical protein
MNYEQRKQESYRELEQAREELKNSVSKVIANSKFSEEFKKAYQNGDKFKMFYMLSNVIDDNADLLAKVSFLDWTKDLADIRDIDFKND